MIMVDNYGWLIVDEELIRVHSYGWQLTIVVNDYDW